MNTISDWDKIYPSYLYQLTDRADLIATPSSLYVMSHEHILSSSRPSRKSRPSSKSTNRSPDLKTSFVHLRDRATFCLKICREIFQASSACTWRRIYKLRSIAKTPFYREIINSKINFVEIILRSFSRVDDKKLFKIFLIKSIGII